MWWPKSSLKSSLTVLAAIGAAIAATFGPEISDSLNLSLYWATSDAQSWVECSKKLILWTSYMKSPLPWASHFSCAAFYCCKIVLLSQTTVPALAAGKRTGKTKEFCSLEPSFIYSWFIDLHFLFHSNSKTWVLSYFEAKKYYLEPEFIFYLLLC